MSGCNRLAPTPRLLLRMRRTKRAMERKLGGLADAKTRRGRLVGLGRLVRFALLQQRLKRRDGGQT